MSFTLINYKSAVLLYYQTPFYCNLFISGSGGAGHGCADSHPKGFSHDRWSHDILHVIVELHLVSDKREDIVNHLIDVGDIDFSVTVDVTRAVRQHITRLTDVSRDTKLLLRNNKQLLALLVIQRKTNITIFFT